MDSVLMPTTDQLLLLLPLILLVAALYSSVGHGGASGYLAVISLMGFTAKSFVPIILTLNVLVAGISFLNYRLPGAFSFRKLLPFIVTSIPASYLGGMWRVSATTFNIILGIALLLAAARLIMPQHIKGPEALRRKSSEVSLWMIGLPVGLMLGFVSGMIGIGGGIFLSPILLFLGLTDIKGSAAMAAAFIVLNSLAGLAGHIAGISTIYRLNPTIPIALLAVAFAGALLGSRWGATRKRPRELQWALASVLIFASLKLVGGALL